MFLCYSDILSPSKAENWFVGKSCFDSCYTYNIGQNVWIVTTIGANGGNVVTQYAAAGIVSQIYTKYP
jgi:hypothetical protein